MGLLSAHSISTTCAFGATCPVLHRHASIQYQLTPLRFSPSLHTLSPYSIPSIQQSLFQKERRKWGQRTLLCAQRGSRKDPRGRGKGSSSGKSDASRGGKGRGGGRRDDATKTGGKSGDARGGRSRNGAATETVKVGGLRIKQEKILQEEEPAGSPQWDTFVSSLAGVWEGMAGAFSPINGKMEPLALDEESRYLFDALSHCFVEPGGSGADYGARRQVYWTVGNAAEKNEEQYQELEVEDDVSEGEDDLSEGKVDVNSQLEEERKRLERTLASSGGGGLSEESQEVLMGKGELLDADEFEEEDASDWEELEEGEYEEADEYEEDDDGSIRESKVDDDVMKQEPGLIFFEDGSYSRGPLDLLHNVQVDAVDPEEVPDDDPKRRLYNINPASVIEQCIVRGGHRRLRMVHTVGIEGGGLNLLRLAVTEEEWMGPLDMDNISTSNEAQVVPFSLVESTQNSDLAGQWKVFERIATVLHGSEADEAAAPSTDSKNGPGGRSVTVCYSTREVLRDRVDETGGKAKGSKVKGKDEDEEIILLPGGMTSTISVKPDGGLTFGVGWLNADGTRAFMERSYQRNGLLEEVRSGQEVKGGWVGGSM